MNDLDLWAFDGGTIKTLDNKGRIEGLAIPFGEPDLSDQRDRFDASTDFGRSIKTAQDVLYFHGLPTIGPKDPNPLAYATIGEAEFKTVDAGVWMTGQLNLANEYEMKVWEMAKAGRLGLSTGAVGHRVRREKNADGTHSIKSWPIGEVSLTPSPANPRTSVYALKSLLSLVPTESPEPEGFVHSLKRAESALRWAIGQKDLNGTKLDALKSLTETVQQLKDSRVDPAKVQAAFLRSEKLLRLTKV